MKTEANAQVIEETEYPYRFLEALLVALMGTLAGTCGGLLAWIILIALPLNLKQEMQREAFVYLLAMGTIVGCAWAMKIVLKRVPSKRR